MPPPPTDLVLRALRPWEWTVVAVAGTAILVSVAVRFAARAGATEAPARRERSVVATATMTLFFLALFVLARRGVGRVALAPEADLAARISGSVLVAAGAALNVAARVVIGPQWSDAIEIRRDHVLVRNGPYRWCRHPMYGSLVVFGAGMALAAANPVALAAVVLLFVPAMVHRARREEALLTESPGGEYRDWIRHSARLVPRLPESAARPARAGVGVLLAWAAVAREPGVALVAAAVVLGLSFAMERRDFRIAWKAKAVFVTGIALAALRAPALSPLLWIPTAAAAASLAGHCPGTLLLRAFRVDDRAPSRETASS